MRRPHNLAEVLQRSESRIDLPVVRNIVARIVHRGGKERRDPDRVDPESREIVHPAQKPPQIAFAVVIGIHEAAQINFVNAGPSPPFCVLFAAFSRHGHLRQCRRIQKRFWRSVKNSARILPIPRSESRISLTGRHKFATLPREAQKRFWVF